jgi:hypothetical protein
VFCQRERASATICLSVVDIETLPYFWVNIWSICWTLNAMPCACWRSCWVRCTFCCKVWSAE